MSIEARGRNNYAYAHTRLRIQLNMALEGRVKDAITVAQKLDNSLSGSLISKAREFRSIRGSKIELENIACELSKIAQEKELLDEIEGVGYFKGRVHREQEEITHIKGELKGHVVDIKRHVSSDGSSIAFYGHVDGNNLSLNPAPAKGILARYECILDTREKIYDLFVNHR
ncbi:MAG TPA: hypothetical protein PKA38_04850 [Candidatus Levybacteria bacterium]|nr:hypothetical protein [Candidatus Levybacteria bacterium]